MTDSDIKKSLPNGPQEGVNYPITVLYCGNCSLPVEYCEYHPEYEKCKVWLEKHLPEEFEKLVKLSDGGDEDATEEKKRQKRGGKGIVKARKKEEVPKQVCLWFLSYRR
uniref:Density-regulated protein homolog n=1 Tax=Cacopsylla melanoneura TaxID=428564 RepID=A0A8D8V9I7_9HEMI